MGISKVRMIPKDIWMGPLDQSASNSLRPGDAKIQKGWVYGEKPAHDTFNWSWNVIMQNMVHIMENGMPKWDKDTTYSKDSLSLSGGSIWRSLVNNNKNHTPPTTQADQYWTYATPLTAATLAEAKSGDPKYDNKYINPRVLKSMDFITRAEVQQMIDTEKAKYWLKSAGKAYVDSYYPKTLRCK